MKISEQMIYGSSRIGLNDAFRQLITWTPPPGGRASRALGLKQYELTDHLGNVLTTISDRNKRIAGENPAFEAVIESAQDYYPFGMLMPGRKYNPAEYRFGFNGQEKDDEITGVTGSHLDFGARIYDSRIGRWMALDPLRNIYPSHSPYCFGVNSPLYFTDPNGKEIEPYFKQWGYGWFSWTTYPYFTGGLTGTHGESFHQVITNMLKSSDIYKIVYSQLVNSSNIFRFTETDITQGGVSGAWSKNNLEANGGFDPTHAGTKADPYIINFNYEFLKGIEGYKSTSTIFEETFHAGQTDYYGSNKPSKIDIEIEAKITGAIEGFNDEFNYAGFDEFVKDFKNGSVSQEQWSQFENETYSYAEAVSNTYKEYHIRKGMSKQEAEKAYGMGSYTGKFKYAEKIFNKKLSKD
jgi:RHS repeat-associated protein